MMYVITSPTAIGKAPDRHSWLLGQPKPKIDGAAIIWIRADGLELEEIHRQIDGIPVIKSSYFGIWRGPWATFIYDNLELSTP